jgi:hypothetical protein
MWFGLSIARIRQALVVFTAIGGLAFVSGLVVPWIDGKPLKSPLVLPFLFLVPPVLWLVLAAFLAVLHLRVTDDAIEQYVWRRILVARKPLATLAAITPGSVSSVVLRFHDGSTMRLLGIHVADVAELIALLQERCPTVRVRGFYDP